MNKVHGLCKPAAPRVAGWMRRRDLSGLEKAVGVQLHGSASGRVWCANRAKMPPAGPSGPGERAMGAAMRRGSAGPGRASSIQS